MLFLAGLLLLALGLLCGAALLAGAAGWIALHGTMTLWILFPIATGFGLLLAGLGSRIRTMPLLLKLTGTILLLEALASVTLLVLGTAGVVTLTRGSAELWYVFAVGVIAGSAGFLIPAAPGEPA